VVEARDLAVSVYATISLVIIRTATSMTGPVVFRSDWSFAKRVVAYSSVMTLQPGKKKTRAAANLASESIFNRKNNFAKFTLATRLNKALPLFS
jgi:hypothetical protein